MKLLPLLFLSLLTTSLFSQTKIPKGIYQGFKFPFLNCFLNVKDSTATVDIFFCNTGHYFGHIPTETLSVPNSSNKEKDLVYFFKNDSVRVYKKGTTIKVKIKRHGIVKMHLTNYNDSVISAGINNNLDFRCYHDLLHELKHKPNFHAKKFNDIYHSYNIHSYYTINTADFKKKLKEIETEERKNFQ